MNSEKIFFRFLKEYNLYAEFMKIFVYTNKKYERNGYEFFFNSR